MKKFKRKFFVLKLLFIAFFFTVVTPASKANQLKLHYSGAASNWNEALPIGNGKIGAMIWGGVKREQLQLNESTLYSGEPSSNYTGLDIRPQYDSVVNLLTNGKFIEAEKIISENWQGKLPQSYQPLGDLFIEFQHDNNAINYKRELDIANSIHSTSYQVDGINYRREIFASYPDNVIVIKLTSSAKTLFSVKLSYDSPHPTVTPFVENNTIGINGQAPGNCERRDLNYIEENKLTDRHPTLFNEDGSRKFSKNLLYDKDVNGKGTFFTSRVKVLKGRGSNQNGSLVVSGKNEIILLVSAATSYNGPNKSPSAEGKEYIAICESTLNKALKKSYKQLLKTHHKDYTSLFNRLSLKIRSDKDYSSVPTDKRLNMFRNSSDNDLLTLLFQYGRYLLISSSREGGQPANLQGIWNAETVPPWNCGYTMNINTPMNYWLAESTGLHECLPPLFTMIKELSEKGKSTARNMYGLPGWTAHHNASIWRETYPTDGNPSWFFWNMSGAWLSRHLWEHYLYHKDYNFLKNEAYPIMKGAAKFHEKWLIQNENGEWLTPISISPENRFTYNGLSTPVAVSQGSTMDRAILHDLFLSVEKASEILQIDDDFRATLREKRENFTPYQIGKKGQLQEWIYDFEEFEPKHRHLSHLYGFYPGNEITFENTPELIPAVRKTIELRGDEATGWSMGWKVNLLARLRDGNHAYKIIQNLFTPVSPQVTDGMEGGLYPNLFDAHPPFQIDGNFGFTAGVVEMLIQDHNEIIFILPALPDVWNEGSIEGIRAKGGFILSFSWKNGNVRTLRIKSLLGEKCKIVVNDKTKEFNTKAGKSYKFTF